MSAIDNHSSASAATPAAPASGASAQAKPSETARPKELRHTLSVLVENKFGVLARVAGMFSGRGYNIDTLNVGPTRNPHVSRMTLVVRGEDATLEQVRRLLEKLVEVIDVIDFREGEYVDRELVLVQVAVNSAQERSEIVQYCDILRGRIIDVHPKRLTVEIVGEENRINRFLMLLEPFGIIEVTRTGKVAMPIVRDEDRVEEG